MPGQYLREKEHAATNKGLMEELKMWIIGLEPSPVREKSVHNPPISWICAPFYVLLYQSGAISANRSMHSLNG